MSQNFKKPRISSERHRRFIASLPCMVTGTPGLSQCAHVRKGVYAAGMKPGDNMTVPLHWNQHALQHAIGEENFWDKYGGIEQAKKTAQALYENTGNREKCIAILHDFRCKKYLT